MLRDAYDGTTVILGPDLSQDGPAFVNELDKSTLSALATLVARGGVSPVGTGTGIRITSARKLIDEGFATVEEHPDTGTATLTVTAFGLTGARRLTTAHVCPMHSRRWSPTRAVVRLVAERTTCLYCRARRDGSPEQLKRALAQACRPRGRVTPIGPGDRVLVCLPGRRPTPVLEAAGSWTLGQLCEALVNAFDWDPRHLTELLLPVDGRVDQRSEGVVAYPADTLEAMEDKAAWDRVVLAAEEVELRQVSAFGAGLTVHHDFGAHLMADLRLDKPAPPRRPARTVPAQGPGRPRAADPGGLASDQTG